MRKVLVIRLSSIGDIVLTSPVVRCLKEQLPGCELHFVVKEAFLPVVSASPFIDKLHTYKGDLAELVSSLRREKFDHIVDLHHNQRTFLIKFALALSSPGLLSSTSSLNKLNLRKWLLVNTKWDLMPDIHIVDRYFQAVKKLGVTNDGKGLDYFIPEGEEVDISQFPAPFHKGYVAFVIGAKHMTKALPDVKVEEMIRQSSQPVILLGGKEDKERGERITASFEMDRVFNACGQFTINQSASIVRQAGLVLTNDTGLMHIAAAFRKNIISFWGNTVPAFGMYPYLPDGSGSSTVKEVNGLSCRPCSKIGYDKCPKGHFRCMNEIGPVEF